MPDFANLPIAANAAVFLAASALVLWLGVYLTRLADRFADVSGIGEAITGAVMLGALTSLAGSVTSVTAAASGHAELALANGVGGIVAQTTMLVAADIAYRHANLEHASASLANLMWGAVLIALLAILLLAHILPPFAIWGVSPWTPLLFAAYAYGVHQVSQADKAPMWAPHTTRETREDVPEEAEAGRAEIVRMGLILLALGASVGAAGWVIAETGLAIAQATGIREGLVGALLTSVATSTPELVTTLAAVRRGALTLAVGGILGGNTFDVLFAAFSDVAYRDGSIYGAMANDQVFLVVLAILMTSVLLVGLLRRERFGVANIGWESITLLLLYVGGMGALVLAF